MSKEQVLSPVGHRSGLTTVSGLQAFLVRLVSNVDGTCARHGVGWVAIQTASSGI